MATAKQPRRSTKDRSQKIVRESLARIDLIAVSGPVFCDQRQADRVFQLLQNRSEWGQSPCILMEAITKDVEAEFADDFRKRVKNLVKCVRLYQSGHDETIGNALKLFKKEIDSDLTDFNAKRRCLFVTRKGGSGTPKFITPFTGGSGTTCAQWTHPVKRFPDGRVIKGFMKAAVTVGFCPVECPFCYLLMPYTQAMNVAVNLEDLADELNRDFWGYPYPINFSETSGFIEYDEMFADEKGNGSFAQFVIDACDVANVTPFFLTKIRYPKYLKFRGNVQVGISLMPEVIRKKLAPNGSPSDELLASLAWAVDNGAKDPVIRLLVMWQEREHYADLLRQCRDALGKTGWRLTVDILRFTPKTAQIIAGLYPRDADRFATEIDPTTMLGLSGLAKEAQGEKKLRPSPERQAEIYRWIRSELNMIGCSGVLLSPCKGNPDELLPLAKDGTINAMPCACYGVPNSLLQKKGTVGLPMVNN